jgi:hypothetical protein
VRESRRRERIDRHDELLERHHDEHDNVDRSLRGRRQVGHHHHRDWNRWKRYLSHRRQSGYERRRRGRRAAGGNGRHGRRFGGHSGIGDRRLGQLRRGTASKHEARGCLQIER